MDLPANPFKAADRYVTLRDKCMSTKWMVTLQRISDMIIMPLIALFYFFNSGEVVMMLTTMMTAYRVWKDWIEFTELQYDMQRMRLRMAQVGGPFITTNDPKYMPYVWADAVVRYT